MITAADLIRLPYTEDMTQAGIAYIRQAYPYLNVPDDQQGIELLREIITAQAGELAFRRVLQSNNIPHQSLESAPFTNPGLSQIVLGGRRCFVITSMANQAGKMEQKRQTTGAILDTQSVLDRELLASDRLRDIDLLVFITVSGSFTRKQAAIDNTQTTHIPEYLVCLMPDRWSHPQRPLGTLTLSTKTNRPVLIELFGKTGRAGYRFEKLMLQPGCSASPQGKFTSLAYLCLDLPATVHLTEKHFSKTVDFSIDKFHWKNLWLYGQEVFLAGYMPASVFRQMVGFSASLYSPAGQYTPFKQKVSIPVRELQPISALFEYVKEWAAEQK